MTEPFDPSACADSCTCPCQMCVQFGATCRRASCTPAQPSLFDSLVPDHHMARTTDPQTSKDAAKSPRRGSQRRRLLEGFAALHPFPGTWDQAADQVGLVHRSAPQRCSELASAGFIDAMGTLRTCYGKQATAYIITADGRKALHAD